MKTLYSLRSLAQVTCLACALSTAHAQTPTESGNHVCITPTAGFYSLYSALTIDNGSGSISGLDTALHLTGTVSYELDSTALEVTESIGGNNYTYYGFMDSTREATFIVALNNLYLSSNVCLKMQDTASARMLNSTYHTAIMQFNSDYTVRAGMYEMKFDGDKLITSKPLYGAMDLFGTTTNYNVSNNGLFFSNDSANIGAINSLGDFFMFSNAAALHGYGCKKNTYESSQLLGEYYFTQWGQLCGDTCIPHSALLKIDITDLTSGTYEILEESNNITGSGSFTYKVLYSKIIELSLDNTTDSKIYLSYSPESNMASGIVMKSKGQAILSGFRNTKRIFDDGTISNPTPINENTEPIYISPVVSNGNLHLKNANNCTVAIIAMNGAVVYSTSANDDVQLPQSLGNGIYKLVVTKNNAVALSQNIILQR